MAVGDFNGDGNLDLVTVNQGVLDKTAPDMYSPGTVSVFWAGATAPSWPPPPTPWGTTPFP